MTIPNTEPLEPSTSDSNTPNLDDIADQLWIDRHTAVTLRVVHVDGSSRNMYRLLERWLASNKLNRTQYESAIASLNELHQILRMKIPE